MATEHNQEAQDLGQEQADSQTAQTQAKRSKLKFQLRIYKLKLPILKKA